MKVCDLIGKGQSSPVGQIAPTMWMHVKDFAVFPENLGSFGSWHKGCD